MEREERRGWQYESGRKGRGWSGRGRRGEGGEVRRGEGGEVRRGEGGEERKEGGGWRVVEVVVDVSGKQCIPAHFSFLVGSFGVGVAGGVQMGGGGAFHSGILIPPPFFLGRVPW